MNIKELLEYLVTPVAQVALIVGLAEVAKKLGLKSNFVPLLDLGLGLISGVLYFGIYLQIGIPNGILAGIAMGLSACGLFSGIKNVSQGIYAIQDEKELKEEHKEELIDQGDNETSDEE